MSINFKYEVWLKCLIDEPIFQKIYVFTETDLVDEFKKAVSNVASHNWEITSYKIAWEEQF